MLAAGLKHWFPLGGALARSYRVQIVAEVGTDCKGVFSWAVAQVSSPLSLASCSMSNGCCPQMG